MLHVAIQYPKTEKYEYHSGPNTTLCISFLELKFLKFFKFLNVCPFDYTVSGLMERLGTRKLV